jgi:hypothetical protein
LTHAQTFFRGVLQTISDGMTYCVNPITAGVKTQKINAATTMENHGVKLAVISAVEFIHWNTYG